MDIFFVCLLLFTWTLPDREIVGGKFIYWGFKPSGRNYTLIFNKSNQQSIFSADLKVTKYKMELKRLVIYIYTKDILIWEHAFREGWYLAISQSYNFDLTSVTHSNSCQLREAQL